MVLCRQPKTYKHLMRTMASQLIEYQSILTTKAKAKHLRMHASRVLNMAKKAQRGERSALNLLKSRIYTKKAEQKLLLDLIPRIKNMKGPLINISQVVHKRKGDNVSMVRISVKGNAYSQYEKKRKQEAIEKNIIFDIKGFAKRTLFEQRQYFLKKLEENPENASFWKQKIAKVEFDQWLVNKNKKEPTRYALLV